jgi:PAS domain S-box-containing protein
MARNVSLLWDRFDLRKRAEEKAVLHFNGDSPYSDRDLQSVIHDLQIHQVELELQNEELQKTQAELAEMARKYSELYEKAPVGFFTFNPKGRIKDLNGTAADLLGMEKKSLLNKYLPFYCSGDGEIFHLHLKRIFLAREKTDCEIRLTKKDGSVLLGFLKSVPLGNGITKFDECFTAMSGI